MGASSVGSEHPDSNREGHWFESCMSRLIFLTFNFFSFFFPYYFTADFPEVK